MKRKGWDKKRCAVWRFGLILLLSALWPQSLRAEAQIGRFAIGGWSPTGWSGADLHSYDRFFEDSDAAHLAEFGVNLLVQTPRIGNKDVGDYSVKMAKGNYRRVVKRVVLKLGTSFLLGNISGYMLAAPLAEGGGGNGLGIGGGLFLFYGWLTGYTAGTAIGVTLVDSHDRFIMSLTGALVGAIVGDRAISSDPFGKGSGIWPVFVCPLVGATIASERWRDSAENSRFSIRLAPDPKRRLSAVATLRF